MKKVIASMLAVAGLASVATAQTYEDNAGRLSFQVWDGSDWSNTLNVAPGVATTVEWRMVANYIGTRTDLFAMGEALYQPVVSGADNTGPSMDMFGDFRNGGVGGNGVAGSLLTEAEGNQSTPLPAGTGLNQGYGRVRFGGTATNSSTNNILTTFRHTGGSDGAPAGSFMRIAGSFVSQWPRVLNPVPPIDVTADDINRILRGVSAQQTSQALNSTFHVAGTSNLVLFRQSLTISADHAAGDVLTISTFQEAIRRVGSPTGTTEPDDRRYMTWQTSATDTGSGTTGHRTSVVLAPATINVVPTPASAALLGLGGLIAARRRRA
jgi:hypothetical protein